MKQIIKLTFLIVLCFTISCSKDITKQSDEAIEAIDGRFRHGSKYKLKTLAQGAILNGANGLDIGADGNLYIGSVNGQEIVTMKRKNGEIVNSFGAENGVLGPDDLVFGPDGTLYWTDIITGFVGRMTPEGVQLGYQAVAQGVNPITFNDEGRLFVALDFLGDGLYELDPELMAPPRPIIECSDPTNPFCLGFFNSFDFGPDGRLYGPLFAAGLVISVDVGDPGDPPSANPFGDGTIQIVAGGFVNAVAAEFGPDGLLYVMDQTGEVFKININTGEKTLFATLPPGLDNLVFDEDGIIYITNADDGWVAKLFPNGRYKIISRGGMTIPQGIAVLEGRNNKDLIYEADLFSIREFDGRNGKELNKYKGFLVPPPGVVSLTLAQNVSASGDDLIVVSFFNSNVQIWNPQDGVLEEFADQVAAPIDAVRLNSGEVIVSDLGLGGVIRLSDNSLIAPLGVASGLATDGETVWAADWATGDIIEINFDGGAPTATVVATGLSFPEGIAIDKKGRLLVYETKGPAPTGESRLSRINFSKGKTKTLVTGLNPKEGGIPGFPPMWFFDGVAVGPSGTIYVRGGEENVIYKVVKNKDHDDDDDD